MLNQNALTPLYEQLKNAIKEDIQAQIYRPGDRMPSEAELEEKYQVSRGFSKKSIRIMAAAKNGAMGILVFKEAFFKSRTGRQKRPASI